MKQNNKNVFVGFFVFLFLHLHLVVLPRFVVILCFFVVVLCLCGHLKSFCGHVESLCRLLHLFVVVRYCGHFAPLCSLLNLYVVILHRLWPFCVSFVVVLCCGPLTSWTPGSVPRRPCILYLLRNCIPSQSIPLLFNFTICSVMYCL